MKSVIERYSDAKGETSSENDPASEIQFWQKEAAILKRQLHNLQENHRYVLHPLSLSNTLDSSNN
jgi:hypothetical protein